MLPDLDALGAVVADREALTLVHEHAATHRLHYLLVARVAEFPHQTGQ